MEYQIGKDQAGVLIGDECDALGLASPYTYIARSDVTCLAMKAEIFHREILTNNLDDYASLKDQTA